MTLTCEMESLIEDRREAVKAAYLDAVARTAAGENLDPAETLGVLEAVGITPAAFSDDVARQQRRLEAETIIAGKADWQASHDEAEAERQELAKRHSAEVNKLATRHAAELAGVRARIESTKQSLDDVQAAEQLLRDSEGVSALDPTPYRPIFGVVVAVNEDCGFITVESRQTPTLGTELYQRYGQLPGIGISHNLIGRRLEIAWHDDVMFGRKLRAVRMVDEAPALAG